MAADSIRARIFRGVAAVSVATTVLMFIAVFVAYQDLERTMRHLVFAEEKSFFLAHLNRKQGSAIETDKLSAVFVPDGSAIAPPDLFSGLSVPHRGELRRNGKTYLIRIDRSADGTLYLAKDISLFERREWLFRGVLAAIVLAALGIGLLLAQVTSTRIARPMARLAAAVGRLTPGGGREASSAFPTDFHEKELREIAGTLARYLAAVDELMRRERRLLAMASHELRTPVAVIAGALEVIEKQGGAGAPAAGKAWRRIRVATDEMREQLAAILALSRTPAFTSVGQADMGAVAAAVLDDLAAAGLAVERIAWAHPPMPVTANADPVLAKMLVRNLIQNALQHTTVGTVGVELQADSLSVSDSGPGLPTADRMRLDGKPEHAEAPPGGALGLYLVTLIAERLGWSLSVRDMPQGGTCVTVGWESA
ncbi:MAG: HAMP domain-containing histidine kinase [Betaproteobacteria bacterium]|nr:HAMP domain-containing histidine kinase [Betaproteobacteria bacterium]